VETDIITSITASPIGYLKTGMMPRVAQ
jgi:hypothetical protein